MDTREYRVPKIYVLRKNKKKNIIILQLIVVNFYSCKIAVYCVAVCCCSERLFPHISI